MGGARITGCAAAISLALVAGAQAAEPPDRAPGKRPVLLLFHYGGFIFDDPSEMAVAAQRARTAGFEPRYVDYPEFDLPGAVATAEAAAQKACRAGRAVFAYGESAGGSLAALLAQRDLVVAAAGYSPVANLRRLADSVPDPELYVGLIQADRALLLKHSPGLHDSDRPILAMRAVGDQPFMNDATRKWDRRDSEVRSAAVPGAHIGQGEPEVFRQNVDRAMAWLQRRTTLTEACSSRR